MRLILTILSFLCLFSSNAKVNFPILSITNNNAYLEWGVNPGYKYQVFSSSTPDFDINDTVLLHTSSIADKLYQNQTFDVLETDQLFFKVQELDEQDPQITFTIPHNNSFGVRRYSNIRIDISDASDIDKNSITLTLPKLGVFNISDSELSYTNNTIYLDLGGITPLGGYEEEITATLSCSDIHGNILDYDWSFELENNISSISNIFVFGSPNAQRSGQKLSGGAARIASQLSGPIRASGNNNEWYIKTVTSSNIIIQYENNPPTNNFSINTPLSNLAPATVDEFFYRIVEGLSINQQNKQLIVSTRDAVLADFLQDGSFSIPDNHARYTVNQNGDIIVSPSRAFGLEANLNHNFTYDFSGTIYSNQTDNTSVNLYINSGEGEFSFNSDVGVYVDIGWSSIEFRGYAHGDLLLTCIPNLDLNASYNISESDSLYNNSHYIIFSVGIIPVQVELKTDVSLNRNIDLDASAEFRTGFSESASLNLDAIYNSENNNPVNISQTYERNSEFIPLEYNIEGSGRLSLSLIPSIEIKVYSLAGLGANFDPEVSIRGNVEANNQNNINGSISVIAEAGLNAGVVVTGINQNNLPWINYQLFYLENNYTFPENESNPNEDEERFIVHPASASWHLNKIARLYAKPQGNNWNLQWYHNDYPIPGEVDGELILSNLNSNHEGEYFLRAEKNDQVIESIPSILLIDNNAIEARPTSGLIKIIKGTQIGLDDFGYYSNSVSGFDIDCCEVTEGLWDIVTAYGIDNGYELSKIIDSQKGNIFTPKTISIVDNEVTQSLLIWCNARSEFEGLDPIYLDLNGNPIKTLTDTIKKINLDRNGYRLPTPTEWSYAARGNLDNSRFPWGDKASFDFANYTNNPDIGYDLEDSGLSYSEYININDNPSKIKVAQFPSNSNGLYDMAGNVWELTWDYESDLFFIKGGSFSSSADDLRIGNEVLFLPIYYDQGGDSTPIGFRTVKK